MKDLQIIVKHQHQHLRDRDEYIHEALRYMLFFADDKNTTARDIKSKLRHSTNNDYFYDIHLIKSLEFRDYLWNNGLFFDVDVTPKSKKTYIKEKMVI